jgi:hypothetical protein
MDIQGSVATYFLSLNSEMICASDDRIRTLQDLADKPAQRSLISIEFRDVIAVE